MGLSKFKIRLQNSGKDEKYDNASVVNIHEIYTKECSQKVRKATYLLISNYQVTFSNCKVTLKPRQTNFHVTVKPLGSMLTLLVIYSNV